MKVPEKVSAIILAGGYSSRMGCEKAELRIGEKSFVSWQTEKLRRMGIEDVIISGYGGSVPGTRPVPDRFPHRGPLSGIHAGLMGAEQDAALVLAVDTPLVPENILRELIRRHEEGITVVSCRGRVEPLIGVYDKALAEVCRELLLGEERSVQGLLKRTKVTALAFAGDPFLLMNCNTPEDYERLLEYGTSDVWPAAITG